MVERTDELKDFEKYPEIPEEFREDRIFDEEKKQEILKLAEEIKKQTEEIKAQNDKILLETNEIEAMCEEISKRVEEEKSNLFGKS